jgi:hypothetical protein
MAKCSTLAFVGAAIFGANYINMFSLVSVLSLIWVTLLSGRSAVARMLWIDQNAAPSLSPIQGNNCEAAAGGVCK